MSYTSDTTPDKKKYILITGFGFSNHGGFTNAKNVKVKSIFYDIYRFSKSKKQYEWQRRNIPYPSYINVFKDLTLTNFKKNELEKKVEEENGR